MPPEAEKKLAVIGQGYVGLPLALLSASKGYKVVGLDNDPVRVAEIEAARSPVSDVSDEDLLSAQKSELYRVSSSYSDVDQFKIAVITVPTPLKRGAPDLSFIESASHSLGGYITRGSLIVLESTTYPGTTEELVLPILEYESGLVAGEDFFLGYSPERIDPGNSLWNLRNTPKIVSGINTRSLIEVANFYSSLGIPIVEVSGTREAELAKLLENTFRHVNIALVNELALFSESLGVDVWESVEAAGTKPFGFMKFTPGPGVGGHCLPVDPSYLSWAIQSKSGSSFKFVELANSINHSMPKHVASKAAQLLTDRGVSMAEARIVLLGLTYKSDTRDLRESPSLDVGRALLLGGAKVFAFDNLVSNNDWPRDFERVSDSEMERFDLAILLTQHSGDPYDSILGKSDVILDTRNAVFGSNVVRL
jgi:UDP-N-acetyl-D-glucosamine dehydrogenase